MIKLMILNWKEGKNIVEQNGPATFNWNRKGKGEKTKKVILSNDMQRMEKKHI